MLGYNLAVPPACSSGTAVSRSIDSDDLLPTLRTPVLLVHGAEDAIVSPAVVDRHVAGMPQAQVHVMANAGHAPFWDVALTFNRRLRAFCASL